MNKDSKKSDTALAEEEMLKIWAKEKTFELSLKNRKGSKYFSFYDGPPFANGLPHYGHVVPSAIKDAIARYKTMRGYYVPRVAGWDTHGLPVEYDVEKQLGLSGKKQILQMGVDKFNQACRESVFRYKGEFEDFIRRLGRWVDLDKAYTTLDDNYIESVWWVFSEIYKKNLIYKSFRSMPYCPRCATPLSNFELNQGYQDDVEDPSVYVLFPIIQERPSSDVELGAKREADRSVLEVTVKGASQAGNNVPRREHQRVGRSSTQQADAPVSFLAWTTTPWTLPANAALAVDPKADYVYAQLKSDGSSLILAKKRLDVLDLRQSDYKILKTVKGKELVGLHYQPLYDVDFKDDSQLAYQIYGPEEGVSLEDGTGILHIAPRYGEFDLELGQTHQLPLLESVDSNGLMVQPKSVVGLFFKKADEPIIADLTKAGRIFAAEKFKHTYPFCWRCDTPLMYFATPTWLVKVTAIGDELVKNNQKINWVPGHIKDGRFGNWLAEARDWGISRNRFWGSPLPVWLCDKEHVTVVGSIDELREKAVNWPSQLDLHRPGIDKIELKCDECDSPAKRIEEVFDCWFESGAMPYASIHYPFESQARFKQEFPADFISEGLDQTRGWFYTLHVLGSALFNQPSYQNVVCHGIVVAGDGKKLSKRLRNYPPLEEVFNSYGSDILRFFMLNSPVVAGEEVRFSAEHLRDTQRNIFMTLQNSFNFFKTYSQVDKWPLNYTRDKQPFNPLLKPQSDNLMDKWILARLEQATTEITTEADKYQLNRASRPLVNLLEDLSNWYIRRSRRRFWKSENDQDKQQAYATLHYTLITICQLMAPWAPFISDRLWRELTKGLKVAPSVHLSDWPSVNKPDKASLKLLEDMAYIRGAINLGLAKRAEAGIKVRQPLSKVIIINAVIEDENQRAYEQIIMDELNVKTIEIKRGADQSPQDNPKKRKDSDFKKQQGGDVEIVLDTSITPELKMEGIARDLVRFVQNTRKNAGFNVQDRILLDISSESTEITAAVKQFKGMIDSETLATGDLQGESEYKEIVKLDGQTIVLSLSRNI